MAENKMEQYCKLPIPIKAYKTDKEIDIETLEGTMRASVGDYIITGVNGESYPCKPDIFEKTYIKYGQANKMAQVAAMFGKKLGEEFSVWLNGEYTINAEVNSIWRMKFTHRGLYIYIPNGGPDGGWWAFNRPVLSDLLTGEAEIVEE